MCNTDFLSSCVQVELIGHLGEHQREEFRKMKLLMEEAMKLREEEEEEINQVFLVVYNVIKFASVEW